MAGARELGNASSGGEFHHSKDDYGLLFMFLASFIGVVCRIAQRNFCSGTFSVPYAVVLLVLGFGLGLLDDRVDLGPVSDTIDTWRNLGGRALVLLFLPPLLFASASTVDFHIFSRIAFQATLLALPGVLLSAALTALSLVAFFPSDWTFTTGMMFGSILAATDPVAVVALLKELGAPPNFSVLVEGESLLNDGVAYALFLLFLSYVTLESVPSVGGMIYLIAFSVTIGVFIGVLTGVFSLKLMGYIWNDPALEICLTIIMTWGVFLLGDALGASGVLAVVAFGLTFASQSMSYLSHEVQHAMHEVWELLEFMANTLVFVYSGLVCASSIAGDEQFLGWDYLGNLFLLYVVINLVRFFVVAVFYVPLKNSGYGMDYGRAFLISWSGLRGAVGLVAAIEVSERPSCPGPETIGHASGNSTAATSESYMVIGCVDQKLKDMVLFYMAGIVVLTILINGTSTQWVIAKLGITKRSQTARKNFERSISLLNDLIGKDITAAKENPDTANADFNVVWSFMPVLSTGSIGQRANHGAAVDPMTFLHQKTKLNRKENAMFSDDACGPEEAIAETRYRFLNFVKANYTLQFENGSCGSWPTLRILNESVSASLDDLSRPLNSWALLEKQYIHLHDWREWAKSCLHVSQVSRAKIAQGWDLAYSFVKSHEWAREKIESTAIELGTWEIIFAECEAMVGAAKIYMRDVEQAYEEIVSSIRTGMVISRTLKHGFEVAEHMYRHAEIEENDFDHIEKVFKGQMLKVKRSLGYIEVRSAQDLFRSVNFFDGLTDSSIKKIKKHATLKQFEHGENLIERGEENGDIFVIIRGQVKCDVKILEDTQLARFARKASEGTAVEAEEEQPHNQDSPKGDRRGGRRRSLLSSGAASASAGRRHSALAKQRFGASFRDLLQGSTRPKALTVTAKPKTAQESGRDGFCRAFRLCPGGQKENAARPKARATNLNILRTFSHHHSPNSPKSRPSSPSSDSSSRPSSPSPDSSPRPSSPSSGLGRRLVRHSTGPMLPGLSRASSLSRSNSFGSKAGDCNQTNSRLSESPSFDLSSCSTDSDDNSAAETRESSLVLKKYVSNKVSSLGFSSFLAMAPPKSPTKASFHTGKSTRLLPEDPSEEGLDDNSQQDVQPAQNENYKRVEYIYGRGETVGDLEALAHTAAVATVTCESIVIAYVIKRNWLVHYIEDTEKASAESAVERKKLEENLLRHAALRAIESWYPILKSSPGSIRPWLTRNFTIFRPPANQPVSVLTEGGIGVVLQGAMLQVGTQQVELLPITVFDIPKQEQTYAPNTVLALLPRSATVMLEDSSSASSNHSSVNQMSKSPQSSAKRRSSMASVLRLESEDRLLSRQRQHAGSDLGIPASSFDEIDEADDTEDGDARNFFV